MDVIIRLLRYIAILLVVLLLAALAAARFRGVAIQLASGEVVGYSRKAGEWLWAQYPSVPLRRDGPYVLDQNGQRVVLTLQPQGDGAVPVRAPAGPVVDVVADADPTLRFRVPLRAQHPRAPTQWPMPEQLLAVSDLEGELTAAVRLLRAQGVIDENLRWSFGRGHLVHIGDMVDRGIDVVPLLWLIYKLEAEAAEAGGAVHYVLGNHERYALQGRPKSAHPKHLATARATGLKYGDLWSTRSELGRWLRSKPAMLKIGDTLFVHGGVGTEVMALAPSLAQIDAAAARYTDALRKSDDPVGVTTIQSNTGVLADRSLAKAADTDSAIDAHLTRLLRHFDAERIAIGHTSVAHVGYTHGGRVLRTNVVHAQGTNEGLLWRDGSWWRVDAGGLREPMGPAVPREQ
jgi:hypothetical protein